jgi:hypothetical protein
VNRYLAACALLLVGCGRFGFALDHDAAVDTPPVHYEPQSASLASFTTSGATYVPVPVTLRIPPSPDTRWLVLVSATLESSVFLSVTVEARYLVDGVVAGLGATQNSAPARGGPWQHFVVVDGTDVERVITFELHDAQGGTATISELEVNAFPLPAGARYQAFDAPRPITATALSSPELTLPFGVLDGDYVFLLLANMSDLPGLADGYIEWLGPAGESWLAEVQQPREPAQSVLVMPRTTVSGDANVELHAWSGSGESTISYVRGLALPLAEFAGFDYLVSPQYVTTTSTVPMIVNALVPTARDAASYQYIATAVLEEACTGTPDAERGVRFVMGTSQRSFVHVTDNCAAELTYGVNRAFTSLPSTFAVAVWSGNGIAIHHRQSTQLVLALP